MTILPVQTATIPDVLKTYPQWLLWRLETRDGKPTKVPYCCDGRTKASSTDRGTWASFAACLAALPQSGCDGLGFVFADDPYCGIDLDACVTAGVVAPWAQMIIDNLDSYTEISVSGSGVHILVRASLPAGGRHRKPIELYDRSRFFTMSGRHVAGTPSTLEPRQDALDALYASTFPPVEPVALPAAPTLTLDDRAILDKASRAKNGGRFTQLMAGNTNGYPSPSEADMALCSLLAFYADGPSQVDRLFRGSGLMRDKWDTRHGESTYGDLTVTKAWTTLKGHYSMETHAHRNGHSTTLEAPTMVEEPVSTTADWWEQLNLNVAGKPKEDIYNLTVILAHHPEWHGRFWWDVVRVRGMVDTTAVDDDTVNDVMYWCGQVLKMSVRGKETVKQAITKVCKYRQRDLLVEWLEALPPWDHQERLTEWLMDVAEARHDAYGMDIARLIPVSMVARALNPGCQYRYAVILEGAEDSGKSKLVEALATPEWYVSYDVNMEGKEAHMLLQGVWVAELAELASLSKTDEPKLKAFLTIREDAYIPKWSNFTRREPRRTIFIGTVNPEGDGAYLKSQTGNTRFLLIPTGHIDIDTLVQMRAQLFAEALVYYTAHPDTWWQLSEDGETTAKREREQRRTRSVYEDGLSQWLVGKDETTFEDIATGYLQLEAKEKWKDMVLQKQIAQAMRALKWTQKPEWRQGRTMRVWRRS